MLWSYCLGVGGEIGSVDKDNMTGLHKAAANGHGGVVKLLLSRGAPLEVKNKWGGTVLSSTIFFALNHPVDGVDYSSIIELLLRAGG